MSSPYQKQCPRCRAFSPLAAVQCGRCGHAFRTRFRKKCPHCAVPADLEATYCRSCGHLYRTPFPTGDPSPTRPPDPTPPPVLLEVPAAAVTEPEPAGLSGVAAEPEPEPYLVPPGILSQIYTPNPWLDLAPGRAPYFAPLDRPVLERRQSGASDTPRFHGDLPPEPFLGDPQAPILLLDEGPPLPAGLRPDPADPDLAERWTANLRHAPLPYPLFPVDPVIGQRFGSGPLARSLAYWLAVYGSERVARAFFLIRLCPYTADPGSAFVEALPSQAYSLELARTKVRSGSLTLLVGGTDRWEMLIPELKRSGHRVLRPGRRSLSPSHGKRAGNLAAATAEAMHRILGSSV